MLEHYFTRGTDGSAPRNFRSIFLYLEHQVQKKTLLPYLPVFTIIIIRHHHRHRWRRLLLLVIPLLYLPIFYQFFFIQHFRHSRPMRSSWQMSFGCGSRVSCFHASEIDLRRARYTWHRLAKVNSSSNRAGTLNIAVRMREVRARPRVGVCAPLSSSLAQK